MMQPFRKILIAIGLCALPALVVPAESSLEVGEAGPLDGVSAAIQEVLGDQGVKIIDKDGPLCEIVLAKTVAMKGAPESADKGLKQIAQGTLLGVMRVFESERDYRDDEIEVGIYTMRFALQPQNGDHLGSSEFPYYALLIPAKADETVDGIKGYDAVTDASKEDTATEHPVVVSLRPADKTEIGDPEIREPLEEHQSVLLTTKSTLPDGADGVLAFELVFKGTGEL